ncbi:MAG TPA: ATP-binding protein [Puia sp.]|jgi:signal transduction histidine kinase
MKLSTQISLGFLIAISIDLLDSYFNYTLTLKVNKDTEFLTRSETIIRNSSRLNKGIVDMQSSFRGFLLTTDDHFLSAYYDGLKTMPQLMREEGVIASSAGQRQKLDSITTLHKSWIGYADSLIVAKKAADSSPAAAKKFQYLFETQFRKEIGKSYNDGIVSLFNSFDQYEYRLREERRSALARSIKRTERFSLIFSILIVIIGSGTAIFLLLKISRRIQSLVKVAENISRGNFARVNDDKTDELSSLSNSLDVMSMRLSKNITDLEKKNVELDQFAYVVSHDLKAPIRGISNVIQWIEEDLQDEISEKMRKHLDLIPERIKRMENLIDGLLEYARISRDKSTKELVDLNALVGELAEIIVPKGCGFIFKDLPTLWTERLLLQQVFSNLISNAVKYGHGQITVSCRDTGNFYEFTISDNGPGIPPEFHERIFIIFQTLREKHDKESTGIGLAIVKKIIEDNHCTIRIVSPDGSGTNFIFTWPKD